MDRFLYSEGLEATISIELTAPENIANNVTNDGLLQIRETSELRAQVERMLARLSQHILAVAQSVINLPNDERLAFSRMLAQIPRMGGPGTTKSDLASDMRADIDVMEQDTIRIRTTAKGAKPFVIMNLKTNADLTEIAMFIESNGMIQLRPGL